MDSKGMLIARAVAALILSGSVVATATEKAADDTIMCAGINTCKGVSACAYGNSSCAGRNACQGQGLVKTTPADCTAKGGKVVQAKK